MAEAALSTEQLMNLPMEDLLNVQVTSVSKYAQKSSEAPAAVEVITADDIRTYGYRTLGDALNGLHGLYASSDGEYNYISQHTPDAYPSRYLIMIDGRRMNDNIYDSADTGQLFLLPMNLVDHIEFIPGPGSSIYGANAMLGVINVISKKGSDINGTQVSGDYGTFGTTGASATYGKLLPNGVNVLVSASTYNTNGPSNLYYPAFDPAVNPGNTEAADGGIAHNMDAENARHLFYDAAYGNFDFTGGYTERFKRIPDDPDGGIFDDPGYYTYDSYYYTELKYNKEFNSTTQVSAEGFDQWYVYHSELPFDANAGVPPVDRVINYDGSNGNWWGGQTQLVTTAFDRQKLVTGVDFQFDQKQHVFNYNMAPSYALIVDNNSDGVRAGVFAQDDVTLAKNWVLSAGGRFDENHLIQGVPFSPRLGLIWDQTSANTMKLLYGSAFRAPNVGERYSYFSPDNTEEHVKNYQLVDEWRPDPTVKYTGSLFYNNYTQVLEFDPNTQTVDNSGRYLSYGYDLEAEKRWTSGQNLKVSFDHTIMYDVTHSWTPDSPKNVSKLQFGQPLFADDAAKLGIENVFVGARRTLQPGMPNAAAYDLVNTNITSNKIFPGADASIGIYDLLNDHAQMVGGTGPNDIQQNTITDIGRTVQVTVQYKF